MAKLSLPADPVLAIKVVDHEARRAERQVDGGLFGRVFGFSTEKSGNIAAFTLIVSFVLFAADLIWGSDAAGLTKKDQLTIISGFITLSLGFVFGRTTS